MGQLESRLMDVAGDLNGASSVRRVRTVAGRLLTTWSRRCQPLTLTLAQVEQLAASMNSLCERLLEHCVDSGLIGVPPSGTSDANEDGVSNNNAGALGRTTATHGAVVGGATVRNTGVVGGASTCNDAAKSIQVSSDQSRRLNSATNEDSDGAHTISVDGEDVAKAPVTEETPVSVCGSAAAFTSRGDLFCSASDMGTAGSNVNSGDRHSLFIRFTVVHSLLPAALYSSSSSAIPPPSHSAPPSSSLSLPLLWRSTPFIRCSVSVADTLVSDQLASHGGGSGSSDSGSDSESAGGGDVWLRLVSAGSGRLLSVRQLCAVHDIVEYGLSVLDTPVSNTVQSGEQSTGQSGEQSIGQSGEQSIGQSGEQSIGQSGEQSGEQSIGQSGEQSIGQSGEQSIGQSGERERTGGAKHSNDDKLAARESGAKFSTHETPEQLPVASDRVCNGAALSCHTETVDSDSDRCTPLFSEIPLSDSISESVALYAATSETSGASCRPVLGSSAAAADQSITLTTTASSPLSSVAAMSPSSSSYSCSSSCHSAALSSPAGDADADECGVECSICLDRVVDTALPCSHSYCRACIERWQLAHSWCPVCRRRTDGQRQMWQLAEAPGRRHICCHVLQQLTAVLLKAAPPPGTE